MFSSPLLATDPTRLPRGLRAWIARRLSGPPGAGGATPHAACLYKVDRLGDFVLALSALRLLLEHLGPERCVLVVSDLAAPLAEREFPATPRLVLPAEAPGILRDVVPLWRAHRPEFRAAAAGQLICLSHQRDLYKDVTLSWIRAPRERKLDRATFPRTAPAGLSLDLEAHRQIVSAVLGRGVSPEEIKPRFRALASRDNGRLLVAPFSNEPARNFPAHVLLATLQRWREGSRAPIDLCASATQAGAARALAETLARGGVEDVTVLQPPTLLAFADAVAAAGAVLAIDSAAAHIATALDKPVSLALGGGTYGLCVPWQTSPRQVAVEHRVPCYGCGWRCTQPEVFCLTRLAPDRLAAALPSLG